MTTINVNDSASEKPYNQINDKRTSTHVRWTDHPPVLLQDWEDVIPTRGWSHNRNLNAITRLILILTITRMALTHSTRGLWQPMLAIGVSLLMFSSEHGAAVEHDKYRADYYNKRTHPTPSQPKQARTRGINIDQPFYIHDAPLSHNDMVKLTIPSRATPGRQQFRSANETRVFARAPLHNEPDESIVAQHTHVGYDKFVSRLL